MTRTVRRLLALSRDELAGRARQEVWKRLERIPWPLDPPLLDEARAAAAMRALISGATPFFPAFRQPALLDDLVRTAPTHVRDVQDGARRIRAGYVPVLGFGPLSVGIPPQWHTEPVADRQSPRVHWSRVPYLDREVVGDHKILWEFNRQQYLVTLAQAWRLTGDAQWLDILQGHLRSWTEENPPRLGVNWASSLEVAYRAISWLWTLAIAGESALPHLDAGLLATLTRSLQVHGRHVERYLSRWFSPNTHLTGEALGLLYLATALPALPEAARWRSLARDLLQAQLFVQVAEDGVYFEQATQYHRYTCEIYLHAQVLTAAAGEPFGDVVRDRIHRAFMVLRALQRPDGTMALLGDDDGGRVLQLDAERPHELTGLLEAAATWFQDPALLPVGTSPMQRWALLGDMPPPAAGTAGARTAAFAVGGQYVIADASPAGGHLTLSCGPHGALNGGHAHADELSFELWAGGAPLLVDRGTCAYGGPARDAFRITSAHNTLELGGESVSLPGGAFSWRRRVDATCTGWVDRGRWTWFEGRHDGYCRRDPRARHQRAIWRPTDGLWLVEDTVADTDGREAVARWHLAPGTRVSAADAQGNGWFRVDLQREGASPATLLMVGASTVRVTDSTVSPQYGACEPAVCLEVAIAGPGVALTTVIVDWSLLHEGSLEVLAEHARLWLQSPFAALATPPTDAPTLVLGQYARTGWPQPPCPLERLLAFRRSAPTGIVCVGRSVTTPDASHGASRDIWCEATPVPPDAFRWSQGTLRRTGG